MGLSSILNTSLTGMNFAQAALETTSHNTANAGVAGYSRQIVDSSSRPGVMTTYGILGAGTAITGVRRMSDEMLVAQYREQSSALATYEQMDLTLQGVETIFGSIDNNHLGNALTEFFNSWSDLASPPVDDSLRPAVINAGEALAADIGSTYGRLEELEASLDDQIRDQADALNGLLESVALLNQQILTAESNLVTANDLRDQRDQILQQISTIAAVDANEREDGTMDVAIGGRTVVSRGHCEQIVTRRNSIEGGIEVMLGETGQDIPISNGALAGLIEMRDGQVAEAKRELDAVAQDLIRQVNDLHGQGRTPGGSGLLFFTGEGAADIALNPALVADPDLIATSRSGLAGDADLAREIADLSIASPGDGQSVLERYNALIVDIASTSSTVRFRYESQTEAVESVYNRLESVRGVNTDEEAANLLRYQNAYNASAQVIQVVQEMYETLLAMI